MSAVAVKLTGSCTPKAKGHGDHGSCPAAALLHQQSLDSRSLPLADHPTSSETSTLKLEVWGE